MSKFTTSIPVAFEETTALLPTGSLINSVRVSPDRKAVLVEWEQDDWRTPYTVPMEVSIAQLNGSEPLPAFIRAAAGFQKVPNAGVEPTAAKRKKSVQ